MTEIGPARLAAGAGVVGTAAAVALLPWGYYGADFGLTDFPNWGYYLSSVVALHLSVFWALRAPSRVWSAPRTAALLLGIAAAVSAIVVMSRYDDAEAFFGPIVPMVIPSLGVGGPVAIVAILVSVGAAVLPGIRLRSRLGTVGAGRRE